MKLFNKKYKADRVPRVSGTLWQIYERKWWWITWKPIRQVFGTREQAESVIDFIKHLKK